MLWSVRLRDTETRYRVRDAEARRKVQGKSLRGRRFRVQTEIKTQGQRQLEDNKEKWIRRNHQIRSDQKHGNRNSEAG